MAQWKPSTRRLGDVLCGFRLELPLGRGCRGEVSRRRGPGLPSAAVWCLEKQEAGGLWI